MKDIIGKMGSNFIVAAFVPALAFVMLAMLIFEPIFPPGFVDQLTSTFGPLGEKGITLLALTVIIGLTLSSLNTFIYKILEGYFLFERLFKTRQRQRRKARQSRRRLEQIETEICELEANGQDDSCLEELKAEQYYIAAELDQRYPPDEEAILPTGFGNIFRAAENYSAMRYGIDAVRVWPRLIHVMPAEYYEKVEQSNNNLAFLTNCSVLSLTFALLSLMAAGYQLIARQYALKGAGELLYFLPLDPSRIEVYTQRAIIYMGLSGVAFIFSWVFYKASFPLANQYGNLIRSAFDLFRFDLLSQLKLKLPEDSVEEYTMWRKVSEFIAVGERLGTLYFDYQIAADTTANGDSSG